MIRSLPKQHTGSSDFSRLLLDAGAMATCSQREIAPSRLTRRSVADPANVLIRHQIHITAIVFDHQHIAGRPYVIPCRNRIRDVLSDVHNERFERLFVEELHDLFAHLMEHTRSSDSINALAHSKTRGPTLGVASIASFLTVTAPAPSVIRLKLPDLDA